MSAREARLRVRQLKAERFTETELGRRLGIKRLRMPGPRVTVRRLLQIRRFYDRVTVEGPELPPSRDDEAHVAPPALQEVL